MFRPSKLAFLIALQAGTALYAQAPAQTADTQQDGTAPVVVQGHPFSAIKYTRVVQTQPDGRLSVKQEAHHILLARDTDGNTFISGADQFGRQCDIPSLGKLPTCDLWSSSLFEPAKATMWHWVDGESADPTQLTQMDITEDQLAEAERLTSVISTPLFASLHPEAGEKLEDLGERTFEGIRSKGFRINRFYNVADGVPPRRVIHEVWASVDKRLVLQVIDGDPAGEETVSGLCHISLSPAPQLFQPPLNRIVRHWKDSSKYAGSDLEWLALWEVK